MTISIATASDVIMPKESMRHFITAKAKAVAVAAVPKNIANSTYSRCLPGLNTKALFMIQQKMFAAMKPTTVATEASVPREAYQTSSPVKLIDGSERYFTAQSSGERHFRHVEAKT